MVPLYHQSGRMVQAYIVMALDMEILTPHGAIRGFVEVLAEVSVEAEAGAVVAVAADLVIGNKFKLACNPLGVNCRKDGYYAKR